VNPEYADAECLRKHYLGPDTWKQDFESAYRRTHARFTESKGDYIREKQALLESLRFGPADARSSWTLVIGQAAQVTKTAADLAMEAAGPLGDIGYGVVEKVVVGLRDQKPIRRISQEIATEVALELSALRRGPVGEALKTLGDAIENLRTLYAMPGEQAALRRDVQEKLYELDEKIEDATKGVQSMEKQLADTRQVYQDILKGIEEYCRSLSQPPPDPDSLAREDADDEEIDSLVRGAVADAQDRWRESPARVDADRARRAARDFGSESDEIMREMERDSLENARQQMKRLADSLQQQGASGGSSQCARQAAALKGKVQQLERRLGGPGVGACRAIRLEREALEAQARYFRSCPAEDPGGKNAGEFERLAAASGRRAAGACVSR
jgi:hypothetical protein